LAVRKIKIKLTEHCKTRAFERNITTDNIRRIINNPIETFYDAERENYKSYGLGTNPPFKEQLYLMIIHSKINTSVTVITAMWMDKGGLKVNGFSKC